MKGFERLGRPAARRAALFRSVHEFGLWHHPQQYQHTTFYIPSVALGQPFYQGTEFPELAQMLGALWGADGLWHAARTEYLSLQDQDLGTPTVSEEWVEQAMLRAEDLRAGRPCSEASLIPMFRTCEGLRDTVRKLQVPFVRASMSLVGPGPVYIMEHASSKQGRIRIHCPLFVPPGSRSELRIGAHGQIMEEGHCFAFDESMGHTSKYTPPVAGNRSSAGSPTSRRATLVVDLVHPDVRLLESLTTIEVSPPPLSFGWWELLLRRGCEDMFEVFRGSLVSAFEIANNVRTRSHS